MDLSGSFGGIAFEIVIKGEHSILSRKAKGPSRVHPILSDRFEPLFSAREAKVPKPFGVRPRYRDTAFTVESNQISIASPMRSVMDGLDDSKENQTLRSCRKQHSTDCRRKPPNEFSFFR